MMAIGFLLGFVGVALVLRTPRPASVPLLGTNAFRVILVGAVFVAVGFGVQAASMLASVLGVSFSISGYYDLFAAAVIVLALGFLLAFLGIALASRVRA